MDVLNQVTSYKISLLLIKAGMPVPEPERGQIWYEEENEGQYGPVLVYRTVPEVYVTYFQLLGDVWSLSSKKMKEEYCPAFSVLDIISWSDVPYTLFPKNNTWVADVGFDNKLVFDSCPADALALAVLQNLERKEQDKALLWELASPESNFLGQDEDGNWYCYKEKPTRGTVSWVPYKDEVVTFVKYGYPNPNWGSTLQERPKI